MNRTTVILTVSGLAFSSAHAQTCGTPWTQGPTAGPTARAYFSMSYDSTRSRVVLFGGYVGNSLSGDTWEWAGAPGGGTWSLAASGGPPAQSDYGLAYDASRQRTVLFGRHPTQTLSQTWEWDGANWTLRSPGTPPPYMNGTLLAYDASRQRIVLVSTLNSGTGSQKTWEYDGAAWTQTTDATPLADWFGFAMAYDAARAKMVLIGFGYTPYTGLPTTWEREAGGWVQKNVGSIPHNFSGRAYAAYDPTIARVTLEDGYEQYGQTGLWTWDGAATHWTFVNSSGPARGYRPMAFDGNQLMFFGGILLNGTQQGETWLYSSSLRSGPQITDAGPRAADFPLHSAPATLSVAATGSGTIGYRWRLNAVELSDSGPFSGTGTPTLTIDPSDVVLSGYYDCVVTDSCGPTLRPSTYVNVSCYANCDNSSFPPRLNAEDFQCFLNRYAAGESYANCDHSTSPPILNANDFQCYLNAFAAGCQ